MATPAKTAGRRTRATGGPDATRPAGRAPDRSDRATQPAPTRAAQIIVTRPRAAAEHATHHDSVEVGLPVVGPVRLPSRPELAFLGGVGLLALAGAVEWPVAVVLGAGHWLASKRGNKVVREFGRALEEA